MTSGPAPAPRRPRGAHAAVRSARRSAPWWSSRAASRLLSAVWAVAVLAVLALVGCAAAGVLGVLPRVLLASTGLVVLVALVLVSTARGARVEAAEPGPVLAQAHAAR